MFHSFDELLDAARARGPVSVAVAAAHDPDVIEALKRAHELHLAEGILVGKGSEIRALAREGGFELSDSQIVNEPDPAAATRQAIALVREGRAGLLMKGKIATASMIRAVLDKDAGLRTSRQLSQVAVFRVPGFDRLMLLTDAAINIAPTLAQKAELCRNAIEVAQAIGIEKPNIAALCHESARPASRLLYRRTHRAGRGPQQIRGGTQGHRQPGGRKHGHLPGAGYRGSQHPLSCDRVLC